MIQLNWILQETADSKIIKNKNRYKNSKTKQHKNRAHWAYLMPVVAILYILIVLAITHITNPCD